MANQSPSSVLNTRLSSLNAVIKSKDVQAQLSDAYTSSKGDWATTLAALQKNKVPADTIAKLDFAHSAAVVTQDNPKLVSAITALPDINSMRDFALAHDATTIAALIPAEAVPATTPGADAATQKTNYAKAVYNQLFAAETSAVLQRMAANAELPIPDASLRTGVVSFLNNQPAFNIRTTSIYTAIQKEDAFKDIDDSSREAVVSQLKTLQRVQAISSTPDTVSKLIKANVVSAHQIAETTPSSFLKSYSDQLGEEEAQAVYHNATNVKICNEQAMQNMADAVKGTGVAFIDGKDGKDIRVGQFNAITAAQGVPLSWESLFGDIDLCSCDDCRSVYSPANYYVELLQYLRNNDLDPSLNTDGTPKYPNTGKKGIAGTPLEKLFTRRPDLGCLELTCENTNTVLPYIDLANEVMESFVVHLDKFKVTTTAAGETDTKDIIDVWNTEDETTGELLAQPQHTNYKAYCILKSAVLPFTLPYHQPIDEIRIFLKFLGTSRYELLQTFQTTALIEDSSGTPMPLEPPAAPLPPGSPAPAPDPNEAILFSLNTVALQRAVDAEYLGMTQEEYIILTKEAYWQKQFFDIKGNAVLTTADYQKNIGVKNVWDYYDYDTEALMLSTDDTTRSGLKFVQNQFLKRTGILYTDLIDLLLTKYINPGYPSGQALTILEGIRFSYRYLQKLVDKSSTDPKVKYAKLIAFLQKEQTALPVIGSMLYADPCNANNPDATLDPQDLSKWVICYFEKVGKLIVLESGDGPYFPLRGEIYDLQFRNNDKKGGDGSIGTLYPNGNVLDAGNKLIGQVNEHSIIVFTGDAASLNTSTLVIQDGPNVIGYTSSKGVYRVSTEADGRQGDLVSWQPPQDTCSIDKVELQHLDGTSLTSDEYDKMQRFIRLWRKLGWTIDETDKAVTGLGIYKTGAAAGGAGAGTPAGGGTASAAGGPAGVASLFGAYAEECDCNPNDENDCGCGPDMTAMGYYYDIAPDLIHQLVAVKKLLDSTGLELIKLLTFWTNISILGDPSLYQRLFLTHNMVGIDPVFQADSNGNYLTAAGKITDHIPVIMSAFNIKAGDIPTIMAFKNIPDVLTLPNISMLYRYSLLMRTVQLKSYQLQPAAVLLGDPFTDADTSYCWLQRWGKIEDAGFDYRQLNYVINGLDDVNKPLTPKQRAMLVLAKTFYDGLNQIDADNTDITSDDEATSDFVRTKASLLYDSATTDKIMGLLEGTTIYTTNAPINLVTQQSDFTIKLTGSLVGKLKYDFVAGSLQVTGILSAAETTAAKAIFPNPDWASAFDRIAKQPLYLYKAVLAGIFPVPAAPPDPAQAVLLQGDSNLTDAQQDPNNIIPDTAPIKRAYFIKAFLPYLRTKLENKFIIDTISDQAGTDADTTERLLTEILVDGTPAASIIETFRGIKNQPPVTSPWNGFLIPAAEDTYTFVMTVTTPTLGATLLLQGQTIAFHQQDDPNNVWLSDPVKLKAGTAYPIVITGLSADLHELGWKTPITTAAAIPASALFPDDSTQTVQEAYIKVQKAAILITGFNLKADEVSFLQKQGADFDGLDFNAITLKHWKHLDDYTNLRNSLPATDLDLPGFFTWVDQAAPADAANLSTQIAALTLWDSSDIDKLIAPEHYNLGLSDFRNEKNLLKLQQALYVAGQISMDINLLFDWAEPSSKFWACQAIAQSIRITTKARYAETDWEQVAAPLNDQLRADQRDALIAYLLVQPGLIKWGVEDADSLFEFFLIDVQMDPCMQTSRIKQAINSVQLFVQRCFLGLEEKYGVTHDVLDRDRWEWMQREVLWVANRKVFLYPENWIDESLRDDKSSFFTELESELLQKDITNANVEVALKNYLFKLDEVSNMSVAGLYIDDANKKVHVFSRTRNAPYFFYYRSFDTDLLTWTPWEKVQTDITSYDVENDQKQVVANGCYLSPVVLNNRLLIFFPLFAKKTYAAAPPSTVDPNNKIPVAPPIEMWEIKMAWSEYRNGKWTQKQVSKDALYSNDNGKMIYDYKFIPVVTSDDRVLIGVEDKLDTDTANLGAFEFKGSKIKTVAASSVVQPTPIATEFGANLQFDGLDGNFRSLQLNNNGTAWDNSGLTIASNADEPFLEDLPGQGGSFNFYHPDTRYLLGAVETDLPTFFESNLTLDDIENAFGNVGDGIYDELSTPYGLYNWELFFHTPAELAGGLSKSQNFEDAMNWYHYIFNPITDSTDDSRVWQFYPFRQSNAKNFLENFFNSLKPNTPDDVNGQINAWRDHPFEPHMIARQRPSAYMKWVVMKYLDNLIAWGDYLFTQHTIESMNQATQLYILASHILGERPPMIPPRGKVKPETYNSLLNKWDAFGNAMVELELVFPYSNQITTQKAKYSTKSVGYANIYGFASTLYFCIPDNPNLLNYWDVVADRLYKIRHCENIEGVFGLPPLWDPPIDPGLLVNAVANGISIASVLNDLSTPLPNYRFNYLMQKSLELCGELKSMGNTLLSVLEKKDGEALAKMRASHETSINNLVMEVKKQQLDEAGKNLDGLQQNRKGPVYRLQHYLKLIGQALSTVPDADTDFAEIADQIDAPIDDSGLKVNTYEKEEMDKADDAAGWQIAIGVVETLASVFHALPTMKVDGHPFGVGASVSWGFPNLANAASAVGRGMQTYAGNLSAQSSSAQRKGGFLRQLQDRVLQANNAGYEIKQIDKQILTQQVRIQIANQEITSQQKQIDNAAEVEDFLTNKYTNEDLYGWMRDSVKALYYQVYTLAYGLAKKAEMVYRYDRGLTTSNFIQFGYWDAGYDGLMAGERLYVGIKQLETAYQQDRGYDFEVTKNISLRQINPLALLQLRETGSCTFELPEVLFDMDFPGHYMRRIRSVGLSIPCIVGPYTGINATLRLQSNKFRLSAIAQDKNSYPETTDSQDVRFSTINTPVTAIAVSTGQNDNGVFELNFKDERYMPFEGAGAISTWNLSLPADFRQFNYSTITDAIIHLRYTSVDGGDKLKTAATGALLNYLTSVEDLSQQEGLFTLFDVQHDFPNEWYKATQAPLPAGATSRTITLANLADRLPVFTKGKKVTGEDIILMTSAKLKFSDLFLSPVVPPPAGDNGAPFQLGVNVGDYYGYAIHDAEVTVDNWTLTINDVTTPLTNMWLVVRYTMK